MGKPVSKNGSWILSWDTWEEIADLPFLIGIGVGGQPLRLAFTLSSNKINRGCYLYKNPDKVTLHEGDWILHINGWLYLGKKND